MTRKLETKVAFGAWGLLAAVALAGCSEPVGGGDTQTNWMRRCAGDGECGGLTCACGYCLETCGSGSECGDTPVPSACHVQGSPGAETLCEVGVQPAGVCLATCSGDRECGEGGQCVNGACLPDAAASGTGGTANAGSTREAVLAFCERWVEEFAAYIGECACGPTAVERYREQSATLCAEGGGFEALAALVESGDLVYRSAAAEALFARLHDGQPLCVEEPYRALKLDSVELYSFAGVFEGTKALGESCVSSVSYKGGISDCREGVCAPDGSGGGRCIELVGVGDACDASGDDDFVASVGRLCHDRRPADSDGEYETAFDSLFCVPSGSDGATGLCSRGLPDGAPCEGIAGDEVCAGGLCASGICASQFADGQPCTSHGECASGACHAGEPRVCGAPLADGEPCSFADGACASGSCNDPDGNGGVCGSPPTRGLGASCSASTECLSSGHGDSRDGTCSDGRCVADICVAYLE